MKEYIYQNKGIYYKKNDFLPLRKTIVFVHGLSGSSAAWKPYEEYFEKKYNILSYDLRGHGKTIKPKKYHEYEMNLFAEDLYDLLKYVGITSHILISHSFGALIALEFLSTYQNIAEGAVFLSPNFSVPRRKLSRSIAPLLKISHLLRPFPFSGKPRGHVDYSKFKNTGDWNIRRMIADIHMTSLRVYLYCSLQSSSFQKEDFLSEIHIPTLIMHGKKDTIFPVDQSFIMAERIKDAKLILLDHADHILVLNYFPQVKGAIEEFLVHHFK